MDYANVTEGPYQPTVRNIQIDNVTVQSARRALYLTGNDGNPIRDVRLTNCTFENMANDDIVHNVAGLEMKNVIIGDERH